MILIRRQLFGFDFKVFCLGRGAVFCQAGYFNVQPVHNAPREFVVFQAVALGRIADGAHQRNRFGGTGFFHGGGILRQGNCREDADNQYDHQQFN